jgi:hypothetical protein
VLLALKKERRRLLGIESGKDEQPNTKRASPSDVSVLREFNVARGFSREGARRMCSYYEAALSKHSRRKIIQDQLLNKYIVHFGSIGIEISVRNCKQSCLIAGVPGTLSITQWTKFSATAIPRSGGGYQNWQTWLTICIEIANQHLSCSTTQKLLSLPAWDHLCSSNVVNSIYYQVEITEIELAFGKIYQHVWIPIDSATYTKILELVNARGITLERTENAPF